MFFAMLSNRSTPIAKQHSRVTERGEKEADKLKPGQFAGQEKKPSTCTAARWVPELTIHLYDSCTVVQLEYKPEFLSGIWHESYFFWTTCCSQKQPLLPSLPGQLQSRDGQCKSLQRPVKVLDTGCSMTGQGKNTQAGAEWHTELSGLARCTRVGKESRCGQPGEGGAGEVTYTKRNVWLPFA